jgi:hypothetical protein
MQTIRPDAAILTGHLFDERKEIGASRRTNDNVIRKAARF